MSQIGCFGKRSPVSGSREPSPVALEKRTGTKIKLPEWMSRFFISIGLIDRKVAPPKHSLCAALLRKTVDPRAVMSELVKLSNDLDDEILQNLSRSELKKIHRSIGNNMETILAAIMELHEALGQDRSEDTRRKDEGQNYQVDVEKKDVAVPGERNGDEEMDYE